jgi:hypothetical protein
MATNKYYSMDASRDANGRINPRGFKEHVGAFRGDPGGVFIDENTPMHLAAAGYGYNPNQSYNFTYAGKDGKRIKQDYPMSDEEYKSGNYTLKEANYKPVDPVGPTDKVTTKLGKATETKDNPYISQRTFFNSGSDGNVSQSSTANTIYKSYQGGNFADRDSSPRWGYGSNISYFSKPNEGGGSNVMTNFDSPIRMDINKGWVGGFSSNNSPGLKFFHRYSSAGSKPEMIRGGARIGLLSSKYNRANVGDRSNFRSAIGDAAWNILGNSTYTSTQSGRRLLRFNRQ